MKQDIVVSLDGEFEQYVKIPLVPDDRNAYRIRFPLGTYGQVSALKVSAVRSDGSAVTGSGAVLGEEAEYVLPKDMYALPGHLNLRLALCDGTGTVLTAKLLSFSVLEGLDPALPASNESDSILNTAMQALAASGEESRVRAEAVQALEESIEQRAYKKSESGGFEGGEDAFAMGSGGALGSFAFTTAGGAVGDNAVSEEGGALGQDSLTDKGGAVGQEAVSGRGFAGGYKAVTGTVSSSGLISRKDAVQLGTGVNSRPYTAQIYHYQLTDCAEPAGTEAEMWLREVGRLSQLQTEHKETIVEAINELAQKIAALTEQKL